MRERAVTKTTDGEAQMAQIRAVVLQIGQPIGGVLRGIAVAVGARNDDDGVFVENLRQVRNRLYQWARACSIPTAQRASAMVSAQYSEFPFSAKKHRDAFAHLSSARKFQ